MGEFGRNLESSVETPEQNAVPKMSLKAENTIRNLFRDDFEGAEVSERKSEIKPVNTIEELSQLFDDDFKEMPKGYARMNELQIVKEEVNQAEKENTNDNSDVAKNCPVENGQWECERGNSKWIPDGEYVPLKKNPEQNNWAEILEAYGIDGINFVDGEPDFSEISKGDVEIEPFSTNRDDNFDKADLELAKQKNYTPEEVAKWRKENGYTWHECKDMKTMQKVPSIVHNNLSHRGGISEAKGRS